MLMMPAHRVDDYEVDVERAQADDEFSDIGPGHQGHQEVGCDIAWLRLQCTVRAIIG